MAKTWYFLHTKPRAEKKLQAWLNGSRIWNYLPVFVNVRVVQRRTVRSEIPIFPSYILARMDQADRIQALKSNLVVMPIPIENPREVIHQLRQVVHAARRAQELKPVPLAEKTGRFVRIKSGPMTGLEGYIVTRGGKTSVVVNMDALGAAFEIDVSPELRPLETRGRITTKH